VIDVSIAKKDDIIYFTWHHLRCWSQETL